MKITYSHEILDGGEDRIMDATVKAVDNISQALLPGVWLVNSLPFLQYLPKWFPGCRTFNRFADETRELVNVMANESYEYAKKHAKNSSCLVTILEDLKASPNSYLNTHEDILRGVCAQAFAAGSETTIISLTVFFLAMRQNPAVQLKAQEEIVRVVGSHRLPDYDDRPLLPYVEAVYREVMRWMPVLPLGLGHRSTADDVYGGYFIPEGTVVLANIWAMTNDEEKYPEPHKFMPERFMNPDGTINSDDTILAFGFGRRVCVGQHFAGASVWRTIAALLAAFSIEKPKDDDDLKHLNDPRDIFRTGAVVAADPFKCSIHARNPEMAELVRNLDL
jgi:cytochrome P450